MADLTRIQVKQLRADARKLETVARHLRQQAKEMIQEDARIRRTEQARKLFFEKEAKLSPGVAVDMSPLFEKEDAGNGNRN